MQNATEKPIRFGTDRNGSTWMGCAYGHRLYGLCRANVVGHWNDGTRLFIAPICRKHANRLASFAAAMGNTATTFLVEVER
jgi:hypothetical protein